MNTQFKIPLASFIVGLLMAIRETGHPVNGTSSLTLKLAHIKSFLSSPQCLAIA
jgi:hypothetical protein